MKKEVFAEIHQLKTENERLNRAIDELINKMLRQTIAQKTHGERNQDMRRWASELIQIQRIAYDGIKEIPF